jgi:hypothetical protein
MALLEHGSVLPEAPQKPKAIRFPSTEKRGVMPEMLVQLLGETSVLLEGR